MTPEQFVFWFQGMLEGNPDLTTLSEKQVDIVKEHLQLVFKHHPNAEGLAHGEPFINPTGGLAPFRPFDGQLYC